MHRSVWISPSSSVWGPTRSMDTTDFIRYTVHPLPYDDRAHTSAQQTLELLSPYCCMGSEVTSTKTETTPTKISDLSQAGTAGWSFP